MTARIARQWVERRGVDHEGEVLGQHGGAHGYTVGQRRGLGLEVPPADGSKRYVVSTDTRSNTVVVGPEELLGVDLIQGDHLRWCGPAPAAGVEVSVGAQVRAHGAEYPATARVDGDRLTVHLDERIRGVAPGQSVVLYQGSRVLGSATISATGRRRSMTSSSPSTTESPVCAPSVTSRNISSARASTAGCRSRS